MDFPQAIVSGFQRYVDFSTRSSRSEFWFWVLFVLVASAVLGFIDGLVLSASNWAPLSTIFGLAVLIPGIAVSVRRLHDIDRTGWWYLLWLVPIVGWIVVIYWACQPGDSGGNRFGADPLAASPAPAPEPTPAPQPTPAPESGPSSDPAPQTGTGPQPEPGAPEEPRRE